MKRTRIIVIGDIHTGSIFGLQHPSSIPDDKKNDFSEWIFKSWEDFCLKYNNPDYLLLIGDLADGSQAKNLGVDAITTDTDEQVRMVKELLMMLIGDKTKIYGINGSGYHGGLGQGTCIDRRATESVNGEFKGNVFEFDIANEKIQISHGGTGSMVNPSTYIQREIKLSKEDAQKRKEKGATILIRGHQHRFYTIQDDAGILGILNGCWQRRTPFMERMSVNVTPSFGATIIDIEDGIVKPYRADYFLPETVRQSMIGFEVLREKSMRTKKKKDDTEWKKTLSERKY